MLVATFVTVVPVGTVCGTVGVAVTIGTFGTVVTVVAVGTVCGTVGVVVTIGTFGIGSGFGLVLLVLLVELFELLWWGL